MNKAEKRGMRKIVNSMATLTSVLKILHPGYEQLLQDLMSELYAAADDLDLDISELIEDAKGWRQRHHRN